MAAKSFSTSLPRGTNLSCTTTRGASIRGNVVATDEKFGALVIKEGNSTGSMHVINLRYLKDLNVLPSSGTITSNPHISLPKVQKRLEGTMETRWSQVQSPLAQKLFLKIKKLIEDTRWEGSVIVVLDDTRISPPYNSEAITGNPKTVEMIKNRVMKSA